MKRTLTTFVLSLVFVLSSMGQDRADVEKKIDYSETYKKAKVVRDVKKALEVPEETTSLLIYVSKDKDDYKLFCDNYLKFTNLRKLVIDDRWDNTRINALPDLSSFKNLEYLQIYTSSNLPIKGIDQLANLKFLELSGFGFKEIPKEILELHNLEVLSLSDSHIPQLPENISELTKLKELDLTNNCFKDVPKEIGQLKQLMVLDLNNADSKGKETPEGLCNNQLTSDPDVFKELPALKRVSFYKTITTAEMKEKVLKDFKNIKITF